MQKALLCCLLLGLCLTVLGLSLTAGMEQGALSRPSKQRTTGSHSLASALVFFGPEVVSMIDEGRIEAYKTWRMNEHGVRDVTVRHDLHALSTFFQCAIKQHWTRDNPDSVRNWGAQVRSQ